LHAVFKKTTKKEVMQKITDVCNQFYDIELLKGEKQKNADVSDSFMTDDDTEKIKEMWAYHMPCVLLIHKAEYWQKLKPIYSEIYTDLSLVVRKSLAASLLEIAKIRLDEPFFTQVLTTYTSATENEEVKSRSFQHLIDYVKLVQPDKQMNLV